MTTTQLNLQHHYQQHYHSGEPTIRLDAIFTSTKLILQQMESFKQLPETKK
jgi:hypothetical protein